MGIDFHYIDKKRGIDKKNAYAKLFNPMMEAGKDAYIYVGIYWSHEVRLSHLEDGFLEPYLRQFIIPYNCDQYEILKKGYIYNTAYSVLMKEEFFIDAIPVLEEKLLEKTLVEETS